MNTPSTSQRHAQGERILQTLLLAINDMIDKEVDGLDADMVVSALANTLGTYIGHFARATGLPSKHVEEWSIFIQRSIVTPIAHKAFRGEISNVKLPPNTVISVQKRK